MEIYKFALNFEKKNREYYEKCAQTSKSVQIKKIFNYLANEEKRHEEIVKKLAEGEVSNYKSDILPKSKEVFQLIADKISKNENIHEDNQIAVYRKAVKMEQESQEYYKKKANEADDEDVKQLLLTLSKEEKRHEIILDHILEHIERPQEWVENAEFNKLEEY